MSQTGGDISINNSDRCISLTQFEVSDVGYSQYRSKLII